MDNKLYNEKSIESLSPLQFTRLRPGVYAGDTTYATQLLVEIFSNAIDEFRLGHGKEIYVTISGDVVTVKDCGQGFIYKVREEDNKTILEAAFSVLNTSGKYREDGAYEGTALGSFGIGSKLTNFLSHWLEVESFRDGVSEKLWFKEGKFAQREVSYIDSTKTGTTVRWKPSEEFFTNTIVEINKVKELFKTMACLCPGLVIWLEENGKKPIKFYSQRGLEDLVDGAVGDTEILNNRFRVMYRYEKKNLDLVLTYTTQYSSTIVPYVNTGLTEKGPHIAQIKSLITREFNKFFREKKWLKDKDDNLNGEDLQEGMYLVFNFTSTGVAYDAQVKSNVTKIDFGDDVLPFLSKALQAWCHKNEKEIKLIADKALSARKAREAAKKARELARNGKKKEKGLKAKIALSDKFINCTNKDAKDRNLLLVEGLSAGSAAVEARNPKTDSIYMLRGKIISPLKTSIDKILKNQEMSDLINIIGGGFGNEFDINKINFDKVVITTDMDSDGADIELLLSTFFFTYMRPLVEKGKLYRAVTPLYIVRCKSQELYFYSEKELADWKQTAPANYELLRAKGLGELNAADLKKVCFENQRFKRLTVSDLEKTIALLDTLQGVAVEPRKKYIYDNAQKLGFHFD